MWRHGPAVLGEPSLVLSVLPGVSVLLYSGKLSRPLPGAPPTLVREPLSIRIMTVTCLCVPRTVCAIVALVQRGRGRDLAREYAKIAALADAGAFRDQARGLGIDL